MLDQIEKKHGENSTSVNDDNADAAFNFEKSLAELELTIKEMEGGRLSLEESLQRFERGVNLIRQCQQVLKQAEQKVEMLVAGENTSGKDVQDAQLQKYQERTAQN